MELRRPLCSATSDYLRHLSRKDMEILWFLLQEHEEALDRLKLAVFSILRDQYEAQEAQCAKARSLEAKWP